MSTEHEEIAADKRLMVYTAAAMYGAAGLDGCMEGLLPGDPPFSMLPVFVVLAIFVALLLFGRRLSRRGLALLGPLGVCLIAYAMATTPEPADAAVLYALPVLWTGVFFGRRGAVGIVACVVVAHAIALSFLPSYSAYPGRWLDVMVSVTAIATVVSALEGRNERLVKRLASEARTDVLTGLLNRRGFNERAVQAIAHARREGARLAVVAFDIDHFKLINDEWGHEAGDRVLAVIGQLLTIHGRDIDVVARRGGEEFAALLPSSDADGATAFAQRIRESLAAVDSFPFPTVRVSAGIAIGKAHDDGQLHDLLERADLALYDAKRAGRDRVFVAGDEGTAAADALMRPAGSSGCAAAGV